VVAAAAAELFSRRLTTSIRKKKTGRSIFRPVFYVMKRILLAHIFIAAFVMFAALPAFADSRDTQIDTILNSAESLFKTMKVKDYKGIWAYLSGPSRVTVVNDTYKALVANSPAVKPDMQYSKEMVESDFRSGGPIAKAYWDAYLQNFNPDWLLEQSKWQMGKIEKGKAEIVIQYRKGEGPVNLQMVAENGKWRVGLMETFRSSKR
jgi:hypothetical protein